VISSASKTIKITVPEGTHAGDEIELSITAPALSPAVRRGYVDTSLPITKAYIVEARERIQTSIAIWWLLEIIVIILLSIGIGNKVMPFAVMSTSKGCGQAQANYYFNLFLGFGTNENTCTDFGADVCIPWTDQAWASFISASGADHMGSYYVSITSTLYAAQVLYILAIVFCFIAWVCHSFLLLDIVESGNAYCCFLSSGYLLLISFAVALSSMINTTASPAFLTYYWNQYFHAGGSIDNLAAGVVPTVPSNDMTCKTKIFYKGGACEATSIAILFVLMIWVLFSACMFGAIVFDVEDTSPTYQTEFRAASRSATHSSEDSPRIGTPKGIKPSTGTIATSPAHAKSTEPYVRSAEEEGKAVMLSEVRSRGADSSGSTPMTMI